MLALRPARPALWSWLAVGIPATPPAPLAAVPPPRSAPPRGGGRHRWGTRLLGLSAHAVWLLVGVGAGTLIVGGGLAWLVVHHRFPGRSALGWGLVPPLGVSALLAGSAS